MTEEEINFRSNPENIAEISKLKNAENIEFQNLLREQNSDELDLMVFDIQEEETKIIDCTLCGNCCKNLMINVEPTDISRLSNHLKVSEFAFKEQYLEISNSGTLAVMNQIPCHFLCNNMCTVYEARPTECRTFPGLDVPHFQKRLFAFFIHYQKCPIIYYTIEKLKTKLNFK